MNDSTKFYNLIGALYDLFDLIFLLGRQGNPRRKLVAAISLQTVRLLDICVGTATTSIGVAHHNPRTQIVGIDLSESMLALARRKIQNAHLTNLVVQQMNASQMAFADGSFDGAMTSFALHEMQVPVREAILREVERVLRPRGWFYLLDFGMQPDKWAQWFLMGWGKLEPPVFHDYLQTDWRTELLKYGLSVQDIQECSFSNLVIAQKCA